MDGTLPVKAVDGGITWRRARQIFIATLGLGLGAVAILALLRLINASILTHEGILFALGGLLLVPGKTLSGRSRFRLILAIEAGIAGPLVLARSLGLVDWAIEVLAHIILVGVIPLLWFVMDLRSPGGPHGWSPSLPQGGRAAGPSRTRD